jgi:predicted acylesterase/phospholipase RssA
MKYDTLCISGGGVKGFSFLSALDILIKYDYINLNNINKYVGTSVGSIISFLLNIDYTPNEIMIYFKNFDFSKIDLSIDLNLFLCEHGFNDGTIYMEILTIFFERKYKLTNINFHDLYILTKKKLYIIGTNFSKGTQETFSYETTPNMLVMDAIRISISLPLLLTPIKYNDNYYIDGSIMNNIAYELCNVSSTLCINFNEKKYFKLNNCFDLMSGIIEMLLKKKNQEINLFKTLFIKENSCDLYIDCNKKILDDLFNSGYQSGLIFLKKEYNLEINKIIKKNGDVISQVKIILNDMISQIIFINSSQHL